MDPGDIDQHPDLLAIPGTKVEKVVLDPPHALESGLGADPREDARSASDLGASWSEAYSRLEQWRKDALEDESLLGHPSEAVRGWCTDDILRRYLVARDGDAAAAISLLEGTVKWRQEYFSRRREERGGGGGERGGERGGGGGGEEEVGFRCPCCCEVATAHCMVGIGPDVYGRAVVYASPPRATVLDRGTVEHIVAEIEKALSCEWCSGRWVFLVDFRGFGLIHSMQPGPALEYAYTFANHYPERLGAVFLLAPPYLFSVLLSAVHYAIDAKTASKLIDVPEADIPALLDRLLPPQGRKWAQEAIRLEPTPGNLPPPDLLPTNAPKSCTHPITFSAGKVKLPMRGGGGDRGGDEGGEGGEGGGDGGGEGEGDGGEEGGGGTGGEAKGGGGEAGGGGGGGGGEDV